MPTGFRMDVHIFVALNYRRLHNISAMFGDLTSDLATDILLNNVVKSVQEARRAVQKQTLLSIGEWDRFSEGGVEPVRAQSEH